MIKSQLRKEKAFEKKVLESAGIFECEECQGSGRIHGKILRNYTTKAQYEEDIEYKCWKCKGKGTVPLQPVITGVDLATGSSKSATMALNRFGSLTPKQKAVWNKSIPSNSNRPDLIVFDDLIDA